MYRRVLKLSEKANGGSKVSQLSKGWREEVQAKGENEEAPVM